MAAVDTPTSFNSAGTLPGLGRALVMAGKLAQKTAEDIYKKSQASRTSFIAEHGHRLSLIEGGVNAGFAAGVNKGLAYLSIRPEIDRFWVLNPDCAVPPGTALAFASESGPAQGFSVMGGRVIYLDNSNTIQIDGGWVNKRTGVTGNVNLGAPHSVPPPDPAGFDFITGASMIVSRAFYEKAGPMSEDYFLYYEEVDWALRRGELPLA